MTCSFLCDCAADHLPVLRILLPWGHRWLPARTRGPSYAAGGHHRLLRRIRKETGENFGKRLGPRMLHFVKRVATIHRVPLASLGREKYPSYNRKCLISGGYRRDEAVRAHSIGDFHPV